MKEGEKRYRRLIEASPDLLVIVDWQGRIIDTNKAAAQLTDVGREALIGSDFFGYFTARAAVQAMHDEVMAHKAVTNAPCTRCHASGTLTEVLFNGTVSKDDHGQVLGVVLVACDVTDQKRIATKFARR